MRNDALSDTYAAALDLAQQVKHLSLQVSTLVAALTVMKNEVKGWEEAAVRPMLDRQNRDALIFEMAAAGTFTRMQIAQRVGINERTVRAILSRARKAQSPAPIQLPPADSSLSVSCSQRKDAADSIVGGATHGVGQQGSAEESTDDAQDGNEPVSVEPVSAADPGEDIPHPSPGVCETIPDAPPRSLGDIARDIVKRRWEEREKRSVPAGYEVDAKAGAINGPSGVLKIHTSLVPVFAHMRDGGLYPISLLADKGGYGKQRELSTALRSLEPRLRAIGIELAYLGRDLVRAVPVEA